MQDKTERLPARPFDPTRDGDALSDIRAAHCQLSKKLAESPASGIGAICVLRIPSREEAKRTIQVHISGTPSVLLEIGRALGKWAGETDIVGRALMLGFAAGLAGEEGEGDSAGEG